MSNDTRQFMMDENQKEAYNTYVDKIGIFDSNTFSGFLEMEFHQQKELLAVPDTLKDWIVLVDTNMMMDRLSADQRGMYQILKYITDQLSKKVGFMNIKEDMKTYLAESRVRSWGESVGMLNGRN